MVERLLTSIKCTVKCEGVETFPALAVENSGNFTVEQLRKAIQSYSTEGVKIELGEVVYVDPSKYDGTIVNSEESVIAKIERTVNFAKKAGSM